MQRVRKINSHNSPLVQSFRMIQLMLNWFREISSQLVIQTIAGVAVIVGVFGLFVILKAGAGKLDMPWPITLLTVQCFSCCVFLVIVAFKYLGKIYHTSVNEQAKVCVANKNKLLRSFITSCPVQRIYIGQINYFENGTSLIITDYVINQAVSLLLLNR